MINIKGKKNFSYKQIIFTVNNAHQKNIMPNLQKKKKKLIVDLIEKISVD